MSTKNTIFSGNCDRFGASFDISEVRNTTPREARVAQFLGELVAKLPPETREADLSTLVEDSYGSFRLGQAAIDAQRAALGLEPEMRQGALNNLLETA